MKDWTQWNPAAFNSGVTGPFLAYATEIGQLLLLCRMGLQTNGVLFSDELLQMAETRTPPVIQTPGVSLPPMLPNPGPIVDNTPPTNDLPSTHIRSLATTVARQANYRPLPTKKPVSRPVQDTNKHKHAVKSHQICYFEDEGSEDDGPGDCSGDGSSSGESVSSNAPAKRQRMSRVVTRSSVQAPAPDMRMEDALDLDTPSLADNLLTNTTMPTSSLNLQHTNTGTADVEPQVTHDINIPPATDADVHLATCTIAHLDIDVKAPPITDTEVGAAIAAQVAATVATDLAVKATSSAHSSTTLTTVPHSPSPLESANNIDESNVPTFLLSHGKGKREVNIFRYLNKVEDRCFRQILLHYIRIETSVKSGVSRSLPTSN